MTHLAKRGTGCDRVLQRLLQEGRLSLDDVIQMHVPAFPENSGP
jgi:hypothetical protein